MSTVLEKQSESVEEVKRVFENYRKDGSSRKTAEYLHERRKRIDALWNKIVETHHKILPDPEQPYFTEHIFDKCKEMYTDMTTDIDKRLAALNQASSGGQSTSKKGQPSKVLKFKIEELYGIMNGIEEINGASTQGLVSANMELLKESWSEFRTKYYEERAESQELDINYATAQQDYVSAIAKLRDLTINPTTTSSVNKPMRLPELKLPQFDGNSASWANFITMFNEGVHKNPDISSAVKVQYLKSCLKGDAMRLVSHVAPTPENYKTCYDLLQRRYNNKREMLGKLLNPMLDMPKQNYENAVQLRRMHDTVFECVMAIKNLDIRVDEWDPLLVHILSKKLSKDTITHYECNIENNRELQSLESFQKYMETRFLALEAAGQQVNGSKNEQKPRVAVEASDETLKCANCGGSHYITKCELFLKKLVHERAKIVDGKGLCTNCLRPHKKGECKSKYTCKTCRKKHNTLLHSDTTTSANIAQSGADEAIVNALCASDGKKVLLATAVISVVTKGGETVALKALIDQGSQNAFISENAVQILRLKKERVSATISGIGQQTQNATAAVSLNVRPRFTSKFELKVRAIVLRKLARLTENHEDSTEHEHLDGLLLADPQYMKTNEIDVILGASEFARIIRPGLIKNGINEPVAQQTELGWILSGVVDHKTSTEERRVTSMITNVDLNEKMDMFFESRDFFDGNELTDEEQMCEKHYAETHTRDSTGRYTVSIPFKNGRSRPELGESKKTAVATFFQLEKRFSRSPALKREYIKFIDEYVSLGHMELVNPNEANDGETGRLIHYLPHHAVLREDSTTTKLRVVFNASQKTSNGTSLNDHMACGPTMQTELASNVLHWRQFKYAAVADIEKMYRQIFIAHDQRDLQRIIWRESTDQPIRVYRLKTITYGTANAPWLAIRTLFQLAMDHQREYPRTCDIIKNSFYVDDLMYGADSTEELIEIYQELGIIMRKGGLNLRKWASNSEEFLSTIPLGDKECPTNNIVKALGLRWNPLTDKLHYKVGALKAGQTFTKRELLSEMSSLFDPLGLISPIMISAKKLFQHLWIDSVGWDDKIPNEIHEEWLRIRNELNLINKLEINRWVSTTRQSRTELIGFCDASQKAYGAVLYLRTITSDEVNITMLVSKARVTPINKKKESTITIPKLELSSAALLARLVQYVTNAMKIKFDNIHLHSDSKVALAWIKGNPNRWKVFVTNHVKKINEVVSPDRWNHVAGLNNPADLASRGVLPSVLLDCELWWNGPADIMQVGWIPEKHTNFETHEEEKASKIAALCSQLEESEYPNVSNIWKMKRVIAYCLLFASNCKTKRRNGRFTAHDLEGAEVAIVRWVQQREYEQEVLALTRGHEIPKRSHILRLSPILDERGLLRVGGRLENADVPYNAKHQIILPAKNIVAKMIILEIHLRCAHGGPRLTEAVLRQKYWMPRSQNEIKAIIRNCVTCFKHNPRAMRQVMADLPAARLSTNLKPFINCVIDNTGDIKTKYNKGRGAKVVKSYATIFVCMATKAIHIEIVSDLTAVAFIAALRRFMARRGHVRNIYSDNATCFTKANKLLLELSASEADQFEGHISDEFNKQGIMWHFNPPAAPHFNGLAEAAVKSVKTHMKRVMGETILTYEELSTLLCQIEACVNSRPLCPTSSDPNDFSSITPGHFLVGQPLLSFPDENHVETKINWLTRWQLVQKMHQGFWERWRLEYLSQLQVRSKWLSREKQPQLNDLVLIKDDNTASNKWPMARIVDLHPGKDSFVRVVTLKTENNTFKRPITKICLLPKTQFAEDSFETKNARANRARKSNVLPIVTALLACFILGSTPIGQANDIFSISSVDHSPGLMFNQKSIAYTGYANWNIICYFDLWQFKLEYKAIKSKIVDLKGLCDKWDGNTTCKSFIGQMEDHLNAIENKNEIIGGHSFKRSKRAALNLIGNIFGDVFGLLDSRFEQQYVENLRKISQNEDDMVGLLKNQTSILDATANIIGVTETELNNQAGHITQMEERIGSLTQREDAMQLFFMLSLKMSDLMQRYEARQDAIMDVIFDAKHGHVNTDVITPQQVEQQLELIRANIDGRKVFVPEDTHGLFRLMRITAMIGRRALFFGISIPILDITKYRVFKIIPVPMLRHDEFAWIRTKNEYLFVSWDLRRYNFVSDSELNECREYQPNEIVCTTPRKMFSSIHRTCEMDIFSRKDGANNCTTDVTPGVESWIEIGENQWFFAAPTGSSLTSICGDHLRVHEINGFGVLTLRQDCVLRNDFFQISSISEIGRAQITVAPLPEIWNNDLTKPMEFTNSSPKLRQLVVADNLTQQIRQMRENIHDPIRLNYHDIHHYGAIYFWIICSIAVFVMILRRIGICRVLVPMPDLSARENVA